MAKESIKFLKTREVTSPSRAFPMDAGIDFFVPKFTKEFITALKEKNSNIFDTPTGYLMVNGTSVAAGTISLQGNGGAARVTYNLNDEEDKHFKFDSATGKAYFLLSPHSRVLIPSGIHSRMTSPGRALIAANKSGVATKHGLVFGAQVVDYTYQGEIHISVINTSTEVVRIYEGMKLIQFIETPIYANPVEITEGLENLEKFYDGLEKDRKDGGFGSTDKK